jgi:biotin carboxylase
MQPIARKRVALVRGRPNISTGGPVYAAAEALGLDLVVVDEEGHWLQADTDENKNHREAFLATDMTEDSRVVDRIIRSLQGYALPIHGIFTLSDNFFVAVSQVAAALDLPTCPQLAFETSVDKYLSRLLQDYPGQTARVNNVDELEALMSGEHAPFSPCFPVIVKPTKGWSSECVSKVNSHRDLETAVQKATGRHGGAAIIEPFVDGPEIDVNFVLLDGDILFCEIADEAPSEADSLDATVDDTFSSVALTLPSALPAEEQQMAKSTLHKILVNLGFRTGVFHVEARVVNSSCEYRHLGQGVVDLVPKSALVMRTQKASCHLLEINARPPAYRVTLASRHVYGVDYFAAHILAAAGDCERLKLVSQPFDCENISSRNQGSQCWAQLLYIPAPTAGIVKSDQPCEELKRRRPDLASHIVLATDYCRSGDKIPLLTDGARMFVAHLLVSNRSSRQDVIGIGEDVRRSFRIDIDEGKKDVDYALLSQSRELKKA